MLQVYTGYIVGHNGLTILIIISIFSKIIIK
jgi:hypothetical protein